MRVKGMMQVAESLEMIGSMDMEGLRMGSGARLRMRAAGAVVFAGCGSPGGTGWAGLPKEQTVMIAASRHRWEVMGAMYANPGIGQPWGGSWGKEDPMGAGASDCGEEAVERGGEVIVGWS